MINAIQIALSGLQAASQRAGASASNIANQDSTGALDPADGSAPYSALTTVQTTQPSGGVQTQVVPTSKPFVPAYDADSPFANGEGLIGVPNVNLAEDIVNLQVARNSYQANIKTIQAQSDMEQALLKMFDRKA